MVTGAGSGLGRAVALALAARQPAVVVLDINCPAVRETAAKIRFGVITPLAIEGWEDMEPFLAERTRRVPIGRRTDAETIAGMIVWRALDAPDYLTAERLNVSGGLDKD